MKLLLVMFYACSAFKSTSKLPGILRTTRRHITEWGGGLQDDTNDRSRARPPRRDSGREGGGGGSRPFRGDSGNAGEEARGPRRYAAEGDARPFRSEGSGGDRPFRRESPPGGENRGEGSGERRSGWAVDAERKMNQNQEDKARWAADIRDENNRSPRPDRDGSSSWSDRGQSRGGERSGGYSKPAYGAPRDRDGSAARYPSRTGGDRSSSFRPRSDGDRPSFPSRGARPSSGGRDMMYSNRAPYDPDRPISREDFEDDTISREPVYGYFDGDHLYGINTIRVAIGGDKRNITELLMQEGMDLNDKKDVKTAGEIVSIAKEKNIPIREFSKHDLNMLSDNRPHQGFVLRAAPLDFIKVEELAPVEGFKCVLALDEVWDPQNFGALLRTAHFLDVDRVVVCAKNSAPLSPVVSKASAGAMELMEIGSTSNMMRFLDRSKANGWQVVGTSLGEASVDLIEANFEKPTILVLGNEGHGMRTNIARRCDVLVKIASMGDASSSVDSLNVSVTGGILLYNILSKGGKASA